MRVVIGAWLRAHLFASWFAADPALAPVSYEARWADVPPDWFAARTEWQEDQAPPR